MKKIETESGIPEDDLQREGLIDRLAQYVAAEPKAWHVRYNLALALLQDGQTDMALDQFHEVLQYSPKHLESLINIGGIHLARGEADLAMKAFTGALKGHDLPIVRANLAVSYMQLDLLAEAETELKRALSMDPNLPDAWVNLGTVLLRSGRLEESLEANQKALAISDQFAMAHNNLAVALAELGRTGEAKKYAQKARDLGYPVHEDFLAELGL